MENLSRVLTPLARLVAFDSRNPPRSITGAGLRELCEELLPAGFSYAVTDLGEGCASVLATRGSPGLLFNVHLDTVPADPGWSFDPLALRVEGDRAVGLGACDIKGAAACLIAAAHARPSADLALLFTSDEEAGSSRCVRAFLAEPHAYRRVVVAEPTRCRAVIEHRGIATCTGAFRGQGGHASSPRALQDSALHEAVRWASRALAFAEEQEAHGYKGLSGIRFNLGVMAGGTKANMIASAAELRYGVRPLPNQRPLDLLAALGALAPHGDRVTWTPGFVAPPLPAAGRLEGAAALARELGLPVGEPVDFWTEAALFSEAAIDAVVLGPGDIAQAHTAGEWVALSQLAEAALMYERVLSQR